MALKKSSNEAVFRKILEELKLRYPDSSGFTIDQLRRKYKWLKQEWRKINNKIRSGSGLAEKDTNSPEWYSLLNPILTEAVDGMMTLSSKATDAESEETSSGEPSEQETWSDATSSSSKVHLTRKRRSPLCLSTQMRTIQMLKKTVVPWSATLKILWRIGNVNVKRILMLVVLC